MQSDQASEVVTLAGLSNEKLMASIQSARFGARRLDVQLLIMLAEVEERRLHLRLAYPSIFDFCRRKLHMSEGEAARRMHASRLVRKLPGLIPHIETGRIHLTTLTMLRDFLTESNIEDLVTATEGKTKNQVKELLASLAPRPDVPARMRKLPDRPAITPPEEPPEQGDAQTSPAPASFASAVGRGRIEPLAPARYKLEMTIGTVERDKLERARDLMRHRLPSGDLTAIFVEALDLLVAKLEKERLGVTSRAAREKGVTSRPRAGRAEAEAEATTTKAPAGSPEARVSGTALRRAGSSSKPPAVTTPATEAAAEIPSRYVPRPVRRAVFVRDGEQCTFQSADGSRCPSRARLELDHIRAFAQGGEPTMENLRVRCRPHNQLHAEDCFGTTYVKKRIEMRQRGQR